jgi:hypothetical protein
MVISYDNDQQVPYADAVMAAGPEQARAIIDDIRPNCVSVIALDADDLQTWKKDLDGRRETTIVRWMAASKKAAQS